MEPTNELTPTVRKFSQAVYTWLHGGSYQFRNCWNELETVFHFLFQLGNKLEVIPRIDSFTEPRLEPQTNLNSDGTIRRSCGTVRWFDNSLSKIQNDCI